MGEDFNNSNKDSLAFVVDLSDRRGEYLYSSLENLGYKVFAIDKNYRHELAEKVKYIYVLAPRVWLELENIDNIMPDSIVFCLGMSDITRERLAFKGCRAINYFDDELLAINNAILTAYGTKNILENADIQIENAKVLVLGGGRVGRSVSKVLAGYNASVVVATKDPIEAVIVDEWCDKVINFKDFDIEIASYNVIINTVPALVLKNKELKKCNKGCFILDLASMPGGVDFIAAKNLGLQVEHALGIPGRFLPIEAAQLMLNSILKRVEFDG